MADAPKPAKELDWWEVPLYRWRNDRSQSAVFAEVDYQKQRCYDSETVIKFVPQIVFTSLDGIQQYVNTLLAEQYMIRRHGVWEVYVKPKSHGHATGACYRRTKPTDPGDDMTRVLGSIRLPRWAWKEWTVLHELAHAINPRQSGGKHGRFWCRIYLDLVGHKMGRTHEQALKQSFLTHSVKTMPVRPPGVLTPECIEQRSQYYTKSQQTKIPAGPDVFPDTIADVVAWVKTAMRAKDVDLPLLKLRRDLRGWFEWTGWHSDASATWQVCAYQLADLTFQEWTDTVANAHPPMM